MGMQIGSGGGSADPEVMIEMNMTPLIDVMLVLIIMLIITIPIQNHAVNLNMPQGPSTTPPTPPVVVNIDVDFDGTVSWDGTAVNPAELDAKLAAVAAQPDQPEIHLRPVAVVPYKSVAAVMAAAQRLNVTKIGMVGNEQFLK
ncbi:ExbD/TolR family protein [Undibacterium pigrum]|uniref:Outer membrane transport energization protein ExbD n=1 Tax=Undibacterium pigrum TaxID=401470 RepID=A0A318IPL5_9BURK|nr:biopolymer transporter ExbD [Undibacterium pigrum]PXX38006.1 outer membrane transport energization protein ExbD [Undibacterium pigrum]